MPSYNLSQLLLRLPAFRLIAIYIFGFCGISLILTLYLIKLSNAFWLSETKASLCQECSNLVRLYHQRGEAGLVNYVKQHSLTKAPVFIYYIVRRGGGLVASNIAMLHPLTLKNGFISAPFAYIAETQPYNLAHGALTHNELPYHNKELPESYFAQQGGHAIGYAHFIAGLRILVGKSVAGEEHYIALLQHAFAVSLTMVFISGIVIWVLLARIMRRRLQKIIMSTNGLIDGNLHERLPVSKNGDEIDLLSMRLNLMLERIELLTNNLRHVADNIAHDLKTPLTRLCNNLEAALYDEQNAKQRNLLYRLLSQSRSLIKTFDALLLISKLENPAHLTGLKHSNLRLLVEESYDVHYEEAAQHNIILTRGELFDHFALINEQLIIQALFNIINNAFKYATGHKQPMVNIFMERDQHYCHIVIEDNGKGILAKDYARITERFTRLDESRSKPGFGIGLSLVKAVIVAHGGKLSFADASPGLRVYLSFPNKEAS